VVAGHREDRRAVVAVGSEELALVLGDAAGRIDHVACKNGEVRVARASEQGRDDGVLRRVALAGVGEDRERRRGQLGAVDRREVPAAQQPRAPAKTRVTKARSRRQV
jgi:hypothetical protein